MNDFRLKSIVKPNPRMLKVVREHLVKQRSLPHKIYQRGDKIAVRKYCEMMAKRLEHMAVVDLDTLTSRFIKTFLAIKKQKRPLDANEFILQLEEAFAVELLRREAAALNYVVAALNIRGEEALAYVLRSLY